VSYPRYPVEITDDLFTYEFYSEGPAGKIKKVISYEGVAENLYNLAFGDWNEGLQRVDDSTRSNNGDRNKVLMTVAFTALDFTDQFPNAHIFIVGSTSGRTRLYQISIGNNLAEISRHFDIWGRRQQKWEPFSRGKNYESFLARRK
jgi:hypothetical protein